MAIVINSTTGEVDLNATTAGLYEVTYTTNGSCPITVTNTVTINALDGATFGYSSNSLPQTGTASLTTTPTTSGGVFSAYPSGLSINSSTGEIDLANSTIQSYKIFYETSGAGCPNSSTFDLAVTASFVNAYSLNLDGVDDRGNAGVLSNLNGKTAFSFSLWLKRSAGGDRSSRFLFGSRDVSNSYRGIACVLGADSPSSLPTTVYIYGTNTSYAFFQFPANYFKALNVWHNLIITFDSSRTNVFIGYWNGGNAVSLPNNNANPSNLASTGNFYVGDDQGVNFKGLIDEFSIFDKSLTAQEASDIYNSGVATDISSLSPLHWWRNEEGTGTTVANSGSSSNVLTLENGLNFSTDVP